MRREETEGRAGKQADGSARTREVKLSTVWSAEARDEEGRPIRDAGSVSHNAAIESIATRDTDREFAPFVRRVLREIERRGFFGVERRVVLGDGAPWIWNFADEHVPDAIQIVDIFQHAEQHPVEVHGGGHPGRALSSEYMKGTAIDATMHSITTALDAATPIWLRSKAIVKKNVAGRSVE